MPKYRIEIREILSKTFEIEAEDRAAAEQLAFDNYRNSESGYTLTSDDYVSTIFSTEIDGEYEIYKEI